MRSTPISRPGDDHVDPREGDRRTRRVRLTMDTFAKVGDRAGRWSPALFAGQFSTTSFGLSSDAVDLSALAKFAIFT
jgi:hypothetical protein